MCDVFQDCILRISVAEPDELRAIYTREIQQPIWTEEEREQLLEAWGTRASYWNKIAVGLSRPRWAVEMKGAE